MTDLKKNDAAPLTDPLVALDTLHRETLAAFLKNADADETERLSALQIDLINQIAAMPATTFEGVIVKLRYLAEHVVGDGLGANDELAKTALESVERLSGRRVMNGAQSISLDPFVALWEKLEAAEIEYHAVRTSPDEDKAEAAYHRMMDIYGEIANTPATTLFGVVAKLRGAWEMATWELKTNDEPYHKNADLQTEHRLLKTALDDVELLAARPRVSKDIRDMVFDIDDPIGRAYYCSTVINHLLAYVGEVQDMKPVLVRIASDMESAVIETRRIFAELHEQAVSGPDA